MLIWFILIVFLLLLGLPVAYTLGVVGSYVKGF